ncbi:hypothetical protein [Yokenella regensburgei]|jgi:hypothetical protein|uniref:Type III secretion system protein SsaO n=1 Tax=Yokenella regensburgei TaxID=158877 RepID=A0AB38G0T2_9ENTR|nr:hypothetical protein [Yokenella regensburgei]EHM45816.1 hypothetical protein HMPREF0880_03862 [Yokenella regensburgei ATCC 43003]KAF1368379.1 hypothetical protein FHR25_002997 [Yokenella regensburgei]SQA65277.1 type III secretion system protein SsaO [Yokenella regensburgei]SQA66570.1 type III secretion system protein SsaO [Yokenella regensburgei]SUQ05128.1 type III secretion system protein SsaO [Yokenella regensburgei]
MLNCLLRIKDRREDRLRRQMTELTLQRQQTEQLGFQCQSRRKDLAQALNQLLLWSGTLSSGELMAQKQAMNNLFHEEYGLAQQQRLLADAQKRLQGQLSELQRELVSVLKKKEKLRSLLSDER